MHYCPFCQRGFALEDVEFMHLIEESEAGRETAEMSADPQEGTHAPFRSRFDRPREAPAPDESDQPDALRAEVYEDTLYSERLNGYQYAATVRRVQKSIRWGDAHRYGVNTQACPPGVIPDDIQDAQGDIYAHQLCPHCHCALPEGYLQADEDHRCVIVLVGGSQSGKTQYLVSFLQGIESVLNVLHLGTIAIAPASRHFYSEMEHRLRSNKVIDATMKHRPVFPIVCTVGHYIDPNRKPYYVTLFDCAGEGLRDPQYAPKHAGLDQASAVMLFIDPVIVYGRGVLDSEAKAWGNFCDEAVNVTLGVIHSRRMCRKITDVVAVMTKMDLLINHALRNRSNQYIDMNPSVRPQVSRSGMTMHDGGVDMATMEIISRETEVLLERGDTARHTYETMIRNYFPVQDLRVCFAGVSTYTWEPDDDAGELEPHYEGDKGRHRVMEPVLYLLARLGALPTREVVREEAQEQRRGGWRRARAGGRRR